jgi:hypothetical protein
MSSALSSAKMNLKHIYQTQCRIRQLVEAMQIYLHRNNPDGGDILESRNGETYHLAGDLVRVSKCQRIQNFTINWSRRWKDACIAQFPVNISGISELTFLDIQTRRIIKQPTQVPCDTLPDNIYVRNNEGTFYEINKQASISRTSLKFEADHLLSEVRINRGTNYDEFDAEEKVPTASILQILQRARLSVLDLTRMTKSKSLTSAVMGEAGDVLKVIGEGTDGFISTIGNLFTDIFGGITSGSVDVIHSITDGARGLVTDTTGILSSSLSHIIMVINEILQWATLFALLGKAFGRELSQRFWNRSRHVRRPPVPAAQV